MFGFLRLSAAKSRIVRHNTLLACCAKVKVVSLYEKTDEAGLEITMHTTTPIVSNRRRGFTLVEILVVLAIICALAALLFPIFSSVRRNARLTSCASNLHQITAGLHMYQQDWDRLPADIRTLSQPSTPSWVPLKPYLNDKAVLQCPYSEMPQPHQYVYRTGPNTSVLNPESSTVVVYCREHLEHDGTGSLPFLNGPNGRYFAGLYIVGRMDGSTSRVQGSEAERWQLYNGQWSGERNPTVGSFVMFRFPKEAWPPRFE